MNTVLILLLAVCAGNAHAADADKQFLLTYPNLDRPGGEVLLENEHVVVQWFVVGPGE